MATYDKIRDEKLQYFIKREAAKISALSSGKNYKYEFLTGAEILAPDQRRVIESAEFSYSPSVKHLKNKQKPLMNKEKTNKCNWRSWEANGWI